jgi:FeS assembly SUF system protein
MSDARTESTPAPTGVSPTKPPSSMSQEELDALTALIVQALKTVYDPEIPADIYELGLIYNVDIDDARMVTIEMTLTAPACPVAGEMPGWVENAIGAVPGVSGVKVNMVFDPPWDQSRMSDEARVALDMW